MKHMKKNAESMLANFLNKIDTACKPMDKNIELPIEMS